jgi:hypothetical protein
MKSARVKSTRERIKWLIRFAEQNLNELRPGDRINLQDEIWLFLRGLPPEKEAETGRYLLTEEEKQCTLENLDNAQRLVKDLFASFAGSAERSRALGGRQHRPDYKILGGPREIKGPIRKVHFSADRFGSGWVRVEADNLEDVFLFALGEVWQGMDGTELRICAAPSCKKLFLIDHGRQKFCSFKCKNKDAQRRYRETHQEQEAKRGRKIYERKMKKKLGPNVRVGKRLNAQ